MSIKLLSLNIEGDNHLDKIVELVKRERPDVVCFQEVFEVDLPFWQNQLQMQAVYVPGGIVSQANSVRLATKGKIGIALFTRTTPTRVISQYYTGTPENLGEVNVRKPEEAPHAILGIGMRHEQQDYRIFTTHFTWASGGGVGEQQRQDLPKLLSALAPFSEFVLCGDFNAPRGLEIFTQLATHFHDNIPASVKTTMDNQLHRVPNLAPLVVDGLFTTASYTATNVRVVSGISDHCAIIGEISCS